jgi:hypothetical protein
MWCVLTAIYSTKEEDLFSGTVAISLELLYLLLQDSQWRWWLLGRKCVGDLK